MNLNSNADNYIGWISDLVTPHLSGQILEIGAGLGDFTEVFQNYGAVLATELSDDSLSNLRLRFSGNRRVRVQAFDLFANHTERFDSVVLINVLEHIKADEHALTAIHEFLNPGGKVVIYVPAFWALYSRFDNSIGHYRRYRRREMETLLRDAGFDIRESRYVNALGAIGWFVICRLLGRNASEGVSVGLMDRVVIPVMRRIEKSVSPPFGISLLTVGQKT